MRLYAPYKKGKTFLELYWGNQTSFYMDGNLVATGPKANPHSIYSTGPGHVILGAMEDNYGGLRDFWSGKISYYENLCTGKIDTNVHRFDGIDDYFIEEQTFVDSNNRPYLPAGSIKVEIYIP